MNFEDYAYYYDMLYKDKDYRKEAVEATELLGIKNEDRSGNDMLVIGCGTGKHDVEFSKIGFNTHGLDLSQQMVDIAVDYSKESDADCTFEQADIRKWKTEKQYDYAVSLFHVMSYMNTNDDLIEAFSNIFSSLKQGGRFVFDVWYGPGVLTDRPERRIKRMGNGKRDIIRIAEPVMHPNDNVVDVCYEILIMDKMTGKTDTVNEVHKMRYYFRPEMEEYLKMAGFKMVSCFDCSTLREPDFNSWTAYFIAEKSIK